MQRPKRSEDATKGPRLSKERARDWSSRLVSGMHSK